MRDNTAKFFCVNETHSRENTQRRSYRPARTLVTSRKSGSYVSLLYNFNNHILRPSHKMADDKALEDRESPRHLRESSARIATRSSQSPRFCATRYVTLATAKENRVKLLTSSAREIPVSRITAAGIRVPPSVMNSSTLHLHSARTENCLGHSRHMRLRDFQFRHKWYLILPLL